MSKSVSAARWRTVRTTTGRCVPPVPGSASVPQQPLNAGVARGEGGKALGTHGPVRQGMVHADLTAVQQYHVHRERLRDSIPGDAVEDGFGERGAGMGAVAAAGAPEPLRR
ncbi:hypothetical protein ACPPVO_23745 [Dactylosporangium sp. McL0621]|uniref:hypothetical protein n=1 Tax=Dactylosporangium sp. McL0621 TaxID=3415678 RepID=UPI003CEE78B9